MAEKKLDQKEMMAAGLHLGHRTSKLHPRMESFVVGIRNTVHVIDLEKTAENLKKALKEIEEIVKNKGVILFVSTKPPLRELVKEIALACGMPYVVERWLGGTFTNFPVISQRAKYYNELKEMREKGQWDKYTKKERVKMNRDFVRLAVKFEGIALLEKVPEAIFVCDIVKDDLPVKEAAMQGVKTIAIIDTNADPNLIDYAIPANDDALTSVRYILEKVKEAVLKSKTAS